MRLPGLLMMSLLLSLTACEKHVSEEEEKSDPADTGKTLTKVDIPIDLIHTQPFVTDDEGIEGRRLAIQHCQRCHMFVEPKALPKEVWEDFVFPRMGAFMGMHHVGVETNINHGRHPVEKQIIQGAGVYPSVAVMPLDDWKVLREYYLEEAPETLDKPPGIAPIAPSTKLFRETPLGYKQINPNTTLVHINEDTKQLFIGDMTRNQLSVLNSDLNRLQKIKMSSAPVHVRFTENDLWVTNIGFVNPSDLPAGELVTLEEQDGYYSTEKEVQLSQLQRPTHASYADMNQDGLTDILMSEYGNQLGGLTYYRAEENGTYQKIILLNEPGSMASHIHDFNSDGLPDVAVVLGQNREGVHIFYNEGDDSFTASYALPLPPSYGSSSIAFYDFNNDGHLDILATNGDNGDYQAVLKSHHGVRIYLNDGKNAFSEHYFFPMNGAFKALAEDFDLDGDLDIAAISMFADLDNRPEEGFVYLENNGAFNFKASTIEGVKKGRWLCMDTGDLDGDGDKDIVIGSFIRGPSQVPSTFLREWEKGALPGLVLWNKTKEQTGGKNK